jgi:hypothetical protein
LQPSQKAAGTHFVIRKNIPRHGAPRTEMIIRQKMVTILVHITLIPLIFLALQTIFESLPVGAFVAKTLATFVQKSSFLSTPTPSCHCSRHAQLQKRPHSGNKRDSRGVLYQ